MQYYLDHLVNQKKNLLKNSLEADHFRQENIKCVYSYETQHMYLSATLISTVQTSSIISKFDIMTK